MRPGILLRFCRKYGIMKGKNIRRGGVGTVNEGLQEYAHRLRVMGQLSSASMRSLSVSGMGSSYSFCAAIRSRSAKADRIHPLCGWEPLT